MERGEPKFEALLPEQLVDYINKLVAEQESLIAKFIAHHKCPPSDIVLIEEQTPTGRVFYPELKSNFDRRLHCQHPGCCCVCGHQGECPEDGPCATGGIF